MNRFAPGTAGVAMDATVRRHRRSLPVVHA
jgi:hypothetical protein